jgi:hypothetical protein
VIEHETDPEGEAVLVDMTDGAVPPDQIMSAMAEQAPMIASMVRWTNDTRPAHRGGGLIDRDIYVNPATTMGKIRTARMAARDDAVGGVLDSTEALALKRVSFTAREWDQQDVWNQWAGQVNLDKKLRSAWRVLHTDSQFVMALWWGQRSFRVSGTTEGGRARRKQFANLQVPVAMSLIDSLKVTPVGSLMFDQEQLAYIADAEEAALFDRVLAAREGRATGRTTMGAPLPLELVDPTSDPIVERLLTRRYEPNAVERKRLGDHGINTTHLFLLDPTAVFRHTVTKADYEPFPDVRMESVFELLDIKHQLRQMDRAHLIGGTNFIVLVKIGSDAHPGLPEEVNHLSARVRTIASVPLIVGDHRLSVEIVTPRLDNTLNRDRYDALDLRIVARLYRMFLPTGGGAERIDEVSKLVGTNLQNDRHMMLRAFESHVFGPMQRLNPDLGARVKMRFHPGRIALEFDAAWASFLLDLREAREISRNTIHSQFELDQDDEAFMLEREAEQYDDVFRTFVPHGANPDVVVDPTEAEPEPTGTGRAAKRRAGRRAGRRRGGAAPGSGQGQAPRNPRNRSGGSGRATTRADAYATARELDIPGRSAMNRDALLEAIEARLAELDDDDQEDDQ